MGDRRAGAVSPQPFSVRLRSRADRARFWFWDPSHFPGPVTPAAESFDLPAMSQGFARAAAELRRPLPASHIRVERGFVYFGVDLPASAEGLASREAAYKETIAPLLDSAGARWRDVYEPAARRLNHALDEAAGELARGADPSEVLDRAVTLRAEQWRIHDLALVPAMEAAARFTAAYADRLGGAARIQTMLQGFPNRQTEAAEALDALAEECRRRPELSRSLLDGSVTSLAQVPSSAAGRWFRDALAGWLASYGARAQGWDVGEPLLAQHPAPVFSLLRDRLQGPPIEPGGQRRRAAEQRDEAVGSALAALPAEEHPAFLTALRAAQAYAVVSEDHNFLIDQQGLAALRRVILAAGQRATEVGRLSAVDDALWLTRAELGRALVADRDLPRVAAARRALHRRRTELTPPRTFGHSLPAWAASNPTLADFFGLGAEPQRTGARLEGVGVSPGRAAGRACVVRSLDEIEVLEPGDILICPTTAPAWTPWLGVVAGAVVETGGMLSHTAVLAREYGIPCVVNARGATTAIPHGALLEIDGGTGAVMWNIIST